MKGFSEILVNKDMNLKMFLLVSRKQNGHITKPIDIGKLGAGILSVLNKQENLQAGKNNSMSK